MFFVHVKMKAILNNTHFEVLHEIYLYITMITSISTSIINDSLGLILLAIWQIEYHTIRF